MRYFLFTQMDKQKKHRKSDKILCDCCHLWTDMYQQQTDNGIVFHTEARSRTTLYHNNVDRLTHSIYEQILAF